MNSTQNLDHGLNAERGLAAAELVVELEALEGDRDSGLHRRAAEQPVTHESVVSFLIVLLGDRCR